MRQSVTPQALFDIGGQTYELILYSALVCITERPIKMKTVSS